MCLIWVTLSAVFFPPMFMPVSKDSKVQMSCTSVVLTNMVQQLKLRPWRRRKLQDKFAIIITRFMLKYTSGSILDLTILVEPQHNGTPKYARISSWTSSKRTELSKNKWPNVIVKTVTCSWLIDSCVEHVHSVGMKMLEETNATNVKNSLTILHKWKTITALYVKIHQFLRILYISSLTCQKFKNNWKNGLMNQVTRVNGQKTPSLQPKHGPTWV